MEFAEEQSRKITFGSILAGSIFVVTLSAFLLFSNALPPRNLGGDDGKVGGDFTLQGYHGEVSLSDFKGKVVMLYFGFTSCKEVCSLSMGVIRNTLQKMQPEEVEQVQVILVSFDPARDSLEELEKYSKQFHANIIGVTGSKKTTG